MSQPPIRKVFIVCGEHSGDALGAGLMRALKTRLGDDVQFAGVGGHGMEAEGLESLFPLDEIAVMGPVAILSRLPHLIRKVYETIEACLTFEPDLLVIIDAPEFTHPVARHVKAQRPDLPIVDYVSPSVWAWRPGRAKKMRPYVDHLLALLPFEPEAHARLGGPPCTYVGHPLIEKLGWYDALETASLSEKLKLDAQVIPLVVLPGSRRSEVSRLLHPFGETVHRLAEDGMNLAVLIPAVPRLRHMIDEGVRDWSVPVHLIDGEDDKWRAFKLSRAALAASGTVTLELGLAGTPMIVGYRVERTATWLRYVINVKSVVLANLVLDENVFPEFIQERCVPEELAPALRSILIESPERAAQCTGLAKLRSVIAAGDQSPSETAADATITAFRDFHKTRALDA